MLTILRIAVQLLLLGMYKTAVLTSLTILSCETTEKGDRVLAMDQKPCPIDGGPDQLLAVLGIMFVVVYGVMPYGAIAIKLCQNGKPGVKKKINRNSAGFITYGWSAMPYRKHAYLWECYNALIIIVMSAGSELIEGESRALMHASIAGFSLLMHALVRPYEDW